MNWKNRTTPPRCFDETEDWEDYKLYIGSTQSPCVHCTPEYRARMVGELRCERPEVVFVRVSDEVIGISADDQRYARLLIEHESAQIIGRRIEHNDTWATLFKHIQARAHRTVQRAIVVWMRRHKKYNKGKS